RAAVGMEQETSPRSLVRAQQAEEFTKTLQAVDRGGAVEARCEFQLRHENRRLFLQRRPADSGEARVVGARGVEDPAVETDLSDARPRMGGEARLQLFQPVVRSRRTGVPRMNAVGWAHEAMAGGEFGHARPVQGMRAID